MVRGWVSNPQTASLLWQAQWQPLIPLIRLIFGQGNVGLSGKPGPKVRSCNRGHDDLLLLPLFHLGRKHTKKTMTRWLFVCLLVQGQDGSKGEKGNLGLPGNPGEPGLRGKDVSKSRVDVIRKVGSQQFVILPLDSHFIARLKRFYIDLYSGNPRAARRPRDKGSPLDLLGFADVS